VFGKFGYVFYERRLIGGFGKLQGAGGFLHALRLALFLFGINRGTSPVNSPAVNCRFLFI
jgi:hypothetical protein